MDYCKRDYTIREIDYCKRDYHSKRDKKQLLEISI